MNNHNQIMLQGCLKEFIVTNELNDYTEQEVFEIFSTLQLTKRFDLTYDDISNSVVDGGNDGGIDVLMILVDDNLIYSMDQLEDMKITRNTKIKLFVFQNKFKTKFEEKALDRLHISIPQLFNLEISEDELLKRFNPKLVELISIFKTLWQDGFIKKIVPEITFGYICKSERKEYNGAFKSKKDQVVELAKDKIIGSTVTFEVYSAEEINEMYRETVDVERVLEFKENPMPIGFTDKEYGYIGVVKLSDYYKFITDGEGNINEVMFESNVRHFQGNVEVNKKIGDTVTDDHKRDFWWLNNGVTIIVSNSAPMPKKLVLSNVQIINGLQTSYTIGKKYVYKDDDERSILVKIIVNTNKETIDKIISASNSQTAVRPDVLRATDSIQRNIEFFFLDRGYYYDRRKNYYKNMGKPIRRIFSIINTGQSVEAILNKNMSVARSSPTSLLKKEKLYNEIYNTKTDLNVYLICNLIWLRSKEGVKELLKEEASIPSVVSNFIYHIARISVSVYFDSQDYNADDIAKLTVEDVDKFDNVRSINILLHQLDKYTKENPEENIINISKNSKFVAQINTELSDYLSE